MDITCTVSDLLPELVRLERIASAKATIPILSHVILKALPDSLTLSATDLEVALVTSCPAEISLPGAVALPAKRILDIAKLLPPTAKLRMSVTGTTTSVTSGTYASKIPTMPVEDFPSLPSPKDLPTLSLKSADLQRLLSRTSFATTDKDVRYYMNGVCLEADGGVLTAVATDGHRLACATAAAPVTVPPTILPNGTVDALTALLTGEEVAFSQSDRHLFFVCDGRLLISRMVDGNFPAWRRILPRETGQACVVGAVTLASALRRVGLGADVIKAVTLNIGVDISLTAGDATETVACSHEGESVKTTCDYTYLTDYLDRVDGEIALKVKDDSTQILLEAEGYLYVVMPIRR